MKGATKRTLPEAVRKAVLGEPFDPISDGGIVQDQGKSQNVIFFFLISQSFALLHLLFFGGNLLYLFGQFAVENGSFCR